ncbi:MAG TPA: hypothetical protein VEW03_11685 [Longimicrobiaceae bacterium]|nr:hypothetical protein [Longimicrobiaceae bacterium]
MKPSIEIPTVHLVLRAHPPGPARVGLVPKPLAGRVVKTAASLIFFWGSCPWLAWIPPHYPWPMLSFAAGAALAYRCWVGKYEVRWFAGACPRCGRPLRTSVGARIDLPHAFTCFGCHFEPRLERYTELTEAGIAADDRGIRHVLAECAGSWWEETVWDQEYVSCSRCGARHHSTAALRDAARSENERGRLLDELAVEGRFLT